MEPTDRHLSLTLDSLSKALAEWTINRQIERKPDLVDRFGNGWRGLRVADVQVRIGYLAQAVATGRPELFTETMFRSQASLMARHGRGDTAELRGSLECLREVVESELPGDAATVIVPYIAHAIGHLSSASDTMPAHVSAEAPHGILALRYLEALLEGRQDDAQSLVIEAVEAGTDLRDVYRHVLQPVQAELGRMWHLGEISVADEHSATAATAQLMARLRGYFPEHGKRSRTMVAAAVGGDLHELGLRMVADFFEMDGWKAHYVGANTPNADIIEVVQLREPDLLAISASTSLCVRSVGELIEALEAAGLRDRTRVMVGGAPFNMVPGLWESVGADGSAADATEAVDVANRLVGG